MMQGDTMMKRAIRILTILILFGRIVGVLASPASHAAPNRINYQGSLTDSGGTPVTDPSVAMTFRIYDDPTSTAPANKLWEETQTVNVVNGIYNVLLGSGTPITGSFDPALFSTNNLWLEVEVNAEVLTPRQQVTSVAFALQAQETAHAVTADDAAMLAGQNATAYDQSTHVMDTGNPHGVTAAQTGAATPSDIVTHAADPSAHHVKTRSFAELADQISDAQIPTSIARDSEILPAVLAADGPGSGLNADLLDGNDAGAFMSSGTDLWVNTTGDAMTGALTLPADGLVVGGSQVVVSGGYVGIGTASPTHSLHIVNNSLDKTLRLEGPGASGFGEQGKINFGDGDFVYLTEDTDDTLEIHARSRTAITGGYVGIGTTSPTAQLTVAGTIESTTGGIKFPDSTIQTTAAASSAAGTVITSLPYTISTPGYYYLSGDLTSSGSGIALAANDVTIDLMGFSIVGPGTGSGINMSGYSNIEVRNGTVRGFFNGIYESVGTGKNFRIINVRTVGNLGDGMSLFGFSHLVKDCAASGNNGNGIYSNGYGSMITGNTSYDNGSDGIYAGRGSTISGNTCYTNRSSGIHAGEGTNVIGNTSYGNTLYGISAGIGSKISDNTAHSNTSTGILTADGSTITGNTAYNNQGYGISAYAAIVTGNSVFLNQQDGIFAGMQSTVIANTAKKNSGSGINGSGAIINNSVSENTLNGIIASGGDTLIKGNNVRTNGQGNIYVAGIRSVIEENTVANSTEGIHFDSVNNYVANNRSFGNTTHWGGTLPVAGWGPGNITMP